jgi:hypothetical protein
MHAEAEQLLPGVSTVPCFDLPPGLLLHPPLSPRPQPSRHPTPGPG